MIKTIIIAFLVGCVIGLYKSYRSLKRELESLEHTLEQEEFELNRMKEEIKSLGGNL